MMTEAILLEAASDAVATWVEYIDGNDGDQVKFVVLGTTQYEGGSTIDFEIRAAQFQNDMLAHGTITVGVRLVQAT